MSTAPSSTHGDSGEPPRKRIRKGTKSCWECKRRKIRCSLSSENVSVCSGCLARGTTCLSQEYPEEHDAPSSTQIGERLGRVELLLEKLVSKISQYEEEENAAKIATPESMGSNDVLTPYAPAISNVTEAPILSLFDNEVIGRRHVTSQSNITTPQSETSGRKTPSCRMTKEDRIRQALVDLLPSQRALDLICSESSCWMLMSALSKHSSDDGKHTMDTFDMSSSFNFAEFSKLHPTALAKRLLYIAVCLQQLPTNFDEGQLRIGSIDARIDKILSMVQTLIISDDELVSTIDGMECLILQGIFHFNSGNPRRAWLTFRRALNVGQLMGIHKADDSRLGERQMWSNIVQADRFLALLLGLPAGSSDTATRPDETFQNPNIDKDFLFSRKLCEIASRVIARNQDENTQAYATTQDIDERLDFLAKAMPPSWWEIPDKVYKSPVEQAVEFDRVMIQIWYFQLESLLHLPFMLRAATERRYDYSKFSCLKASREMLRRYLALRGAPNQSFCCKVVDFGALTATVTLCLGLLDTEGSNNPREVQVQKDQDRNLVMEVLQLTERLAEGGKDVVATQSMSVIKTLLDAGSPSAKSTGNLRLTIPYFGTINIARPQSPSPIVTEAPMAQHQVPLIPPAALPQTWEGIPPYQPQIPLHMPVVSFTSSQFPVQVPSVQEWQPSEADTLFFDSLLNTDIEGNWLYQSLG